MPEGQAVVLDNPRDPMAILLTGQRNQQMAAYRQQQLGLQQRKASDADMNRVLSHKYEDPGERFRAWGQETINKANQRVMDVYQNNLSADPSLIRSQIINIQGVADKELNTAKEINNIYNEKIQSLGAMKDIVDPSAAKRILNQTINKSNPFDVDRSILENIEQVPAIYDENALVASSVKGIKDQFRQTSPGEIQSSPLGLFMEIKENKMRFKDLDKTIDFILRGDDVTDIGIQQKVNGGLISDRLRYDIARDQVSSQGGDPEDVSQVMAQFRKVQYDPKYAPQVRKRLRGILEQFNQEERDVHIQSMGKFKQTSLSEDIKENRLMMRDQNLKNMLNPFESASATKPKAEAQKAISRILGGDFGGGRITEAKYEKGNVAISPEWMRKIGEQLNAVLSSNNEADKKVLQQTIREANNHLVQKSGNKIKFSIKTGTIFGQPEEISGLTIDLSDPNAEAIVNALMNKNAGESNIPLDDVYFFRNKGKKTYLDEDDDGSGGFLDEDEESDEGYLDD